MRGIASRIAATIAARRAGSEYMSKPTALRFSAVRRFEVQDGPVTFAFAARPDRQQAAAGIARFDLQAFASRSG